MLNASCTDTPRDSIFNPGGPAAARIAELGWEMIWIFTGYFLVTLLLLALALRGRKREKSPIGFRFVFVLGIALPTLILVKILISTLQLTLDLGSGKSELQIEITSHHWWFEVRYPGYPIIDANEIHIPVGKMIRFKLLSKAVVHSFWVPRLTGKRDMLPDHPTELRMTAGEPGIYHGTCTEYCAGPHALMAFKLIAHEPAEFEKWLRTRAEVPAVPVDPVVLKGRTVFEKACANCHAIRGLSEARVGPDLTYMGSRTTIGAGTVPNTKGNMAGWIANPQKIKPRNLMPRSYLPPEDLHSLLEYLESLK
ncbi:MAG: hypothetical protein A2428_10210 [Bdellovibrionales bacterium RIFOXYC1_FULL_54_43]|nr:MAG: hypothetical protein A2428_10210 [Bdellovibrionales bacterium RIFOXYC1_FULL_54_43]OFZ80547.1 MAG: hypothetical protein A2603_13045 [Bdellovibrionales bacterium RIFOXYD1_FULL_55_31]